MSSVFRITMRRLVEIRDGETPVLDEGDIRSHIIATAELAKDGECGELPSNAWMMHASRANCGGRAIAVRTL